MTCHVTLEMVPQTMHWVFPLFKWMTGPENDKSATMTSQSSVLLATFGEVMGITRKYYNSKCKQTRMPRVIFDVEKAEYL